jgi:2-polyprenyl-6-methoxyphenol hydroxylase-like FAD-dependent oxidoreductase
MAGASGRETTVIVVGGGPVGLAAALELARFDIPTVVLEQRDSTSRHPKTRNLNTRTMEIARGWGRVAYERLRAVDTPPGWKSPIRFLESVVGEQFGEIESKGFEGPGRDISPALPVMSSQDLFEQILSDACRATGSIELRFGHRVTSVLSGWRDGDAYAEVEVESTRKVPYRLSGAAIVAADGIDSLVRTQLQIPLDGEQAIHHFINCYFRSQIEPHIGERSGVLLFIANANAAGVLQPLDANGRWLCQLAVAPEEWSTDVFPAERVQRWVRSAVGVDELDVDVMSVGRWRMNAAVARRFARLRVVLCGDAAHQFPPTGGLGVNTGLQGMHNAMWKLALCVRGLAGWGLLDTYEKERRDPSKRTAGQSLENHRNVGLIAAAAFSSQDPAIGVSEVIRTARRYGNHLGVEFGTVYSSSAVVPDGTSAPEVEDSYSDYVPGATPGSRAPHVWLGGRGKEKLSTQDLFGAGFTVLAGRDGAQWCLAAAEARGRFRVPIASYVIDAPGLEDRAEAFLERYGIASDGAVLVRPDGYVAWRAASGPTDGGESLVQAFAQVLHLPGDSDDVALTNRRINE